MLPRLADNSANKIIVVPADMAGLAGLATSIAQMTPGHQRAPLGPPAGRALEAGNGNAQGRPQITAGGAVVQ
jgi:hypothetical protein